MKIPKNLDERDAFYDDIIRKCTASQEDRKNFYATLEQYYLFGGGDKNQAPFNKVFPHIDLLTSFLYASETTKFMVKLGADVDENEHSRVPVLNRSINDKWLDSNTDRVASHAVTWGLVYNTTPVKLIHRVNEKTKRVSISPFAIHPGNFGVLREDLPFIDMQEAMTHSYYTTRSQLEIDLAGHPQKNEILADISPKQAETSAQPTGAAKLIMSSLQPLSNPSNGNVEIMPGTNFDYEPNIAEDVVEMVELWIWDTDLNDYRMVTKIKDGATIFDRDKNIFLPGEHPFVLITPNPLPFYIWGASEVAGLVPLQQWRNERIDQIRKLLDLQVKPPTSVSGFGIVEESAYAMFAAGGLLPAQDGGMNPKLERFTPDIPPNIYEIIHEIDQSFSEHSGLPNTVQGKGEVGVRSGKQTSELARLGSARIKKRSLVVEDALEKIATLFLKLMQKYDATEYLDKNGIPFIAEQFSTNYVVKVDAHSNSPIFIEDKKELAFEMLKSGMIDKARALEMIDPPDKEVMLRELKILEDKAAAAQKAEMAEAEKIAAIKHDGAQATDQQKK